MGTEVSPSRSGSEDGAGESLLESLLDDPDNGREHNGEYNRAKVHHAGGKTDDETDVRNGVDDG